MRGRSMRSRAGNAAARKPVDGRGAPRYANGMRAAAPLALLLAACTSTAPASTTASSSSAAPAPTGPVRAGDKAPSFALPVAGEARTVALDDVVAANALTVVMFIATRCPVSLAYDGRMAALGKEYGGKGVAFVGVNANVNEPVDEIAAHAKEHGFTFPVVKDAGNVVADRWGARVTPEIYVIDRAGVVRYHGRIDEQQADPANVKSPDLKSALDALLSGGQPANPETKAFGCSIKRA